MRRLLILSLSYVALLTLASPGSAQTVIVFAASSLTDALGEIGERFEAERPGARVLFSFASSSTLATQLLHGAPSDVFASANDLQLERVAADDLLAGTGTSFAGNTLVLLVPNGSDIDSAADLATPGVLLVVAATEVPAGRYARAWLSLAEATLGTGYAAAVLANVVSNEPNVRQAAAKVALGEADAAMVYRSDALGLEGVRIVTLPGADTLEIRYPIARLAGATQPELADAFVAFVLSDAGQEVLERYGFSPAPP